LLDLIELGIPTPLPTGSIVIETGGMKTHRRERTREELHRELSDGFGLPLTQIHSEYGMAEMLTQGYRRTWDVGRRTLVRKEEVGKGEDKDSPKSRFQFPHWAQVLTTDHRSSIIDHRSLITDLANLYSCSFLISGDRIEVYDVGSFEVLGRIDPTDFRGCNFLMERD
jgi:hypothetical protein